MKYWILAVISAVLLVFSACSVAPSGETSAETETETLTAEESKKETEEETTAVKRPETTEKETTTEETTTEEETTREPTDREWFENIVPYAWSQDQPLFMAIRRDASDPSRIVVLLNLEEAEVFHADDFEERADGELFYMCESGSIIEYCPSEDHVKLTRDGERHVYFPDRSGLDFTKFYKLSSLGAEDQARIGRLFTVTCYDWNEESRKKYLYKEGYAYINIEADGSTWYYGGETEYVPGLTLVNKSGEGPTLIVYFGDERVHNVTMHDLWFDVENMPEITRTNADGSEYQDTTWKFLYWGIDPPVTADNE